MGCKAPLMEQTGCLGGRGGLVNVFMPFANSERGLVIGIGSAIHETLYGRGFLLPKVTPDYWLRERRPISFNGRGLKLVLDEIVQNASVETS